MAIMFGSYPKDGSSNLSRATKFNINFGGDFKMNYNRTQGNTFIINLNTKEEYDECISKINKITLTKEFMQECKDCSDKYKK